MPNSTRPVVSIDVPEEPAVTRVDVQVSSPAPVRSLARFAYVFVREHLGSVAALGRVLRGDYRRGGNGK